MASQTSISEVRFRTLEATEYKKLLLLSIADIYWLDQQPRLAISQAGSQPDWVSGVNFESRVTHSGVTPEISQAAIQSPYSKLKVKTYTHVVFCQVNYSWCYYRCVSDEKIVSTGYQSCDYRNRCKNFWETSKIGHSRSEIPGISWPRSHAESWKKVNPKQRGHKLSQKATKVFKAKAEIEVWNKLTSYVACKFHTSQ